MAKRSEKKQTSVRLDLAYSWLAEAHGIDKADTDKIFLRTRLVQLGSSFGLSRVPRSNGRISHSNGAQSLLHVVSSSFDAASSSRCFVSEVLNRVLCCVTCVVARMTLEDLQFQ